MSLHIKRELVRANSEILCSCGKLAIIKWVVNTIIKGKIAPKELCQPKVINFCTICHKKEVDNWNKTSSHFISKKMSYNIEEDTVEEKAETVETVGDLIKVLQEYKEDTPAIITFDNEALRISDVKGTNAQTSYKEHTVFGKRVVLECDTIRSRWPEERAYT